MKYSTQELLKFLYLSNKKLKKTKRNFKNVRIERNKYKFQIQQINNILNDIDFKYYDMSKEYYLKLEGKSELKEEILKILNK